MEATQKILKLIADETGFPFVASSLQKILSLTGSDATSTHELVDAVLDHIALTERLLKIANSVSVSRGGPPVGTVNGAVLVTGFDTVRAISTALLALQGFERYGHRSRWLPEFKVALLAAQVARQMAASAGFSVAEDCATAALFRGVGRILAAAVAPEDVEAVQAQGAQQGQALELASRARFGLPYATLTRKALQAWNLPSLLQQRAVPLDPGPRNAPGGSDDWIAGMSSLAYAMAETANYTADQRDQRLLRLQAEYGALAGDSVAASTDLLNGALHEVQRILAVIEPELESGIATLPPAALRAPAFFLVPPPASRRAAIRRRASSRVTAPASAPLGRVALISPSVT